MLPVMELVSRTRRGDFEGCRSLNNFDVACPNGLLRGVDTSRLQLMKASWPRGSKHPTFEVSAPNNHCRYGVLGSETSSTFYVGYLDSGLHVQPAVHRTLVLFPEGDGGQEIPRGLREGAEG